MGLSSHHIIYNQLPMERILPVVMVDKVALLLVLVVALENHVVELMRDFLLQDLSFLGSEESVIDVGFDIEDFVEECVYILLGVLDGFAPYVEA